MRTIDIHAHWYPQEWLNVFAKDGAKEGAALERSADGRYHLRAKHITNAFDERFVVVDERVSAMDRRRVDVHALSLTTPMVYWASPGLGVALSQAFNGAELDEQKFWNVYAKCEELGWPIFLHPVDTIGQDRTKKYYLKNLCGNPYDTGVAAAHLIFGGVLDRFEKLQVNLPHAGGAFPGLIGRLDHGTRVRPELKHMKQPPSAYLRRFTYDTIGHDDRIK